MRNNWSQASVNNQQAGSSGPSRTGGLLSRYQQHQSQEQFSPASPPAMQQGGQPQPVDYRLQGSAGPQHATNFSFPPQPLQGFWNGAVNMVRR
ncbi:MAG: hypothetical protein IMW89_13810, partial [Ktedonobacteraceae bacterium]|nr:hypothetical protein [Ktedonobacteraceae bacterium]